MPNVFQGSKSTVGDPFGIVVSRWNDAITSKLLEGAVETLKEYGVADEAIDVAWVPGAFEIPLVADQMASSGRYAAVLCLGAVIRGETTHDQHINRAVSLGITEAGLRHGIPVLFGVLTCDTFEQAIQRAGGRVDKDTPTGGKKRFGNKGVECAEAALEMVDLMKKLPRE
ncbi:MAG: 6,7-dimethyl-8-ribityllumazine synthase [Pirellulales bacterium]|nr:6,7-dimethyl-8-ribityllumazine synthase [Pirellulales bacterium]